MNDKQNGDANSTETTANPPFPSPVSPKNEAKLGDAEEKPTGDETKSTTEKWRAKPIEWLQLAVNSVLAIVGIAAVCIYSGQLKTMQGQLNEMTSGASDTHNLAVAAGTQANAAKSASTTAQNALSSSNEASKKILAEMEKQSNAMQRAANAAIDQSKITQNSLDVSQRAYVSIGRKDGAVADFAISKEPGDKAGIFIYFQNSGHLPAKFNWGLTGDIMVVPPDTRFAPITSEHKFNHMTRIRDRKNGGITNQSTGVTVPGDSLYVTDIAEIPRSQADQLSRGNQLFLIHGAFEYCDAFGNYSCREFLIFYQGAPYSRFNLATDNECPILFFAPPASPVPNTDYLPTCPT